MKELRRHSGFRQRYRCLPSSLLPFLTTLVVLQLGQGTGSNTIEQLLVLRSRANILIILSLTQV